MFFVCLLGFLGQIVAFPWFFSYYLHKPLIITLVYLYHWKHIVQLQKANLLRPLVSKDKLQGFFKKNYPYGN